MLGIIIILYTYCTALGEASFKLVTDDWAFLSIFLIFFSTFSHRAGRYFVLMLFIILLLLLNIAAVNPA
jgi:hypothetical protein